MIDDEGGWGKMIMCGGKQNVYINSTYTFIYVLLKIIFLTEE